jgi:hypothetical protein
MAAVDLENDDQSKDEDVDDQGKNDTSGVRIRTKGDQGDNSDQGRELGSQRLKRRQRNLGSSSLSRHRPRTVGWKT